MTLFFAKMNPFPEALEGNLFAKEHRHFESLSDRVAVQVVCLAKMCRSLRLSKGAFCKRDGGPSRASGTGMLCYGMWFAQGLKTEKATGDTSDLFG